MAKKGLPKRIYVNREVDQNDEDTSWLNAHASFDSIDDGEAVGVYELVETKTKRVTNSLV